MQALKVFVVVMAVAIVAIIVVIAVTLGERIGARDDAAAGFDDMVLPVPKGCVLARAEAAERRLILRLDGPAANGCQQVIMLDLDSGRELGRITAAPGQ